VCPITTDNAEPDGSNIDPIDIALAWNDGDPRATIGMLLDDCRHLRLQLALAEAGMSPGFTRGWVPSFERSEGDRQ
jgi:hypothetical protein